MGKKRFLRTWVVILLIIIALIISAYFIFAYTPTIKAQLFIEQGNVEVNLGSGWQAATDEMILEAKDKVRTLNGKATIILFESEIFRMEENTEITIQELSTKKTRLYQESGTTWTKINKIAGVEQYDVETPTTVATVRGTSFLTTVIGNNIDSVVGEGEVSYFQKNIKERFTIKELQRTQSGKESFEILNPTEEQLEKINTFKNMDLETLKKIRFMMIKRNKIAAKILKSKNIDDKEINDYLEKVDNGQEDPNKIIKKIPIKVKGLEKFKKINEEIKKQKKNSER